MNTRKQRKIVNLYISAMALQVLILFISIVNHNPPAIIGWFSNIILTAFLLYTYIETHI